MSLIKSVSTIRNLAYLGTEINHLFNKYGNHRALRLCRPLLVEYYYNMDFDWREWENHTMTKNPLLQSYVKTQVPINHIIPSPGTPLGYRYRSSGDNQYPFDMFVINWQPGQKSAIHYHPVFGCKNLNYNTSSNLLITICTNLLKVS